jgi:hypothetical protein
MPSASKELRLPFGLFLVTCGPLPFFRLVLVPVLYLSGTLGKFAFTWPESGRPGEQRPNQRILNELISVNPNCVVAIADCGQITFSFALISVEFK